MNCKKHIQLTGVSNISWKDAIVKTIQDASQTLNNLTTLKVIEQRARIQGDKIQEYYVDLDLEFEIDKCLQGLDDSQNDNLDEIENLETISNMEERTDNLRRYQGNAINVTNNYICLATTTGCDLTNAINSDKYSYRIIGIMEEDDPN